MISWLIQKTARRKVFAIDWNVLIINRFWHIAMCVNFSRDEDWPFDCCTSGKTGTNKLWSKQLRECGLKWLAAIVSRPLDKFNYCSRCGPFLSNDISTALYVYEPTRCTKFLWLDFIFPLDALHVSDYISPSWRATFISCTSHLVYADTCSAVGWGTAVRFPMVSLKFFIDIILPAALWPWGRLSL